MSNDRIEAIQAVAERVESYQEGAEDGVVEAELRKALDEAGIEVSDEEATKLLDAIQNGEGNIDVEAVLG